jgi:hypothetical protein
MRFRRTAGWLLLALLGACSGSIATTDAVPQATSQSSAASNAGTGLSGSGGTSAGSTLAGGTTSPLSGAGSTTIGSQVYADASVGSASDAAAGGYAYLDGAAPASSACWAPNLPAEVQPIPAPQDAGAVCAASASTTWAAPLVGDASASEGDARSAIVGRWIPCGTPAFSRTAHAGVEFGANGRWRLLDASADGTLVPQDPALAASRGYYEALAFGQMNLAEDVGDVAAASVSWTMTFSLGVGGDALLLQEPGQGAPGTRLASASGIYARVPASPLDGADNPPSTSDGTCSLIGTWDLPASPSAPAATLSFDEAGNFVGGPAGSDLCTSYAFYGTYWLSPGLFELTTNVGMGACQWWFTAGYQTSFASDCGQLTLTDLWDNCTGGRGYFNEPSTLTRRP